MTEPARSGNTGKFLRKIFKLSAWGALCVAGLAAAAALWFLLFFPSEKAARVIEAQLAERLGTPVRIAGLRLSPLEGLEAGPVRIGPEPGGEGQAPWLLLDRIVFRFDLWQAFHGRYVVRALRLENVTLLLKRGEAGWNWQARRGAEAAAVREEAPRALDVSQLRLEVQELEIGPLYVRVVTPEAEAGVGPLRASLRGALEPGGSLRGTIRAGHGSDDLASLELSSAAKGWKAHALLGGVIGARMENADLFSVEADLRASSAKVARPGQPSRVLADASFSLRGDGSLREGRAIVSSLNVEAGAAARVEAKGSVTWPDRLAAEVRLSRLSADIGEAAKTFAALGIELPLVAGHLAGDGLRIRYRGTEMAVDGAVRVQGVELSSGAVSAKGIAAGISFDSLALAAGGFPSAGGALLEGSWSSLQVGAGLGFPDGKVAGDLRAKPSGPAVATWSVDSGIAAALPPLSHQGAISLQGSAELDGKARSLRFLKFTGQAGGALIAGKGFLDLTGSGAESLSARVSVDIPRFLGAWGSQSAWMRALLRAGAAGELVVDTTLEREARKKERRLGVQLESRPSVREDESYGLREARVDGDISAWLGPAGLERPSGHVEISAGLLQTPFAGGEKANLKLSLSGGAGGKEIAGNVSFRVARFWYGPRDPGALGSQRSLPLDVSAQVRATRGRDGLEKLVFGAEAGPVLALTAKGSYRPGSREISLRASTRKPWPLQGLLQAVPPAYRPRLQEGPSPKGRLSWRLETQGILPSGVQGFFPFPLDGEAELSWQGIGLQLARPRLDLAGFSGEIHAGTPNPSVRALQVRGHWAAESVEAGDFRPAPLGPVEGHVELRTAGSSQWVLDELLVSEGSLPAVFKAKGAWSPLATPAALWAQASLDAGGAEAAGWPAGFESTGALRTALALSREGEGPLRMEGDVRLDGLSLRGPNKLVIEEIRGTIPILTALDLNDGARLMEAQAAAGASSPGRLPSLLYGELSALSPLADGAPLEIRRLALPRAEIRQVRTRARAEGPRVFLDGLSADFLDGSLTGGAWAEIGSPLEAHLSLAARSLNFQKVLPAWRISKDTPPAAKEYLVDGDANLTFRYPPADLSGEFEVTRLGRDVLFALMDWADPAGTNAGMKNAKSILRNYAFVGPKSVRIPMAHGSADFTVHVHFTGDQNALRTLYKGILYNLVQLPKEFHMQIPLKALLGTVLR